MATPLMSPWKVRYVVPWKTRSDLVQVFHDLYSDDRKRQSQGLERIATWKSRVGNKLSVAIESSATLVQACKDHQEAVSNGSLSSNDWSVRCSLSLALIRFVNHITEKGQTKATAQPVHLVAKEFGIPDWIVRLRHDATHSSLPCLDTLSSAASWALKYLKKEFWECQLQDSPTKEEISAEGVKKVPNPSVKRIRRAISSFQKSRFEELKSSSEDKAAHEATRVKDCQRLSRYLRLSRPRFINCLLEDGALIATAEQLEAFCIRPEVNVFLLLNRYALSTSTPYPLILSEFWKPVIHEVYSQGALPMMVQAAMFSVSSAEDLRNNLLVAWMAAILSNSAGNPASTGGTWHRKQVKRDLFRKPVTLPKKMLLTACLQNMNRQTAHLLKYVALEEEIGMEAFLKLSRLLNLTAAEDQLHEEEEEEAELSDGKSDLDPAFTIEDLIKAKEDFKDPDISEPVVDNIQASISGSRSIWKLCPDVVQWAKVPLGCLPSSWNSEEDDGGDENEEEAGDRDGDDSSLSDGQYHSDLDLSSADEGGEEEATNTRKRLRNSQNNLPGREGSPSPKRSNYIVKDEGLL